MKIDELKNPLYKKLANKYKVIPVTQIQGERKCNNCGCNYIVKFADLKRGWGKCCSKSCACSIQGGYCKSGSDFRFRESEYLQGEIN